MSYSQTAILIASENFRNLRDAPISAILHSEIMDDSLDENPDIRPANLLRAWRDHRKMTMEELAVKVGTTQAVIWHLENAKRKLSPKWLYRLGPALGISPGWLLDHHPDDVPSDIMDIWDQIPKAQQQTARDVLLAFKPFPKTGTDGQ